MIMKSKLLLFGLAIAAVVVSPMKARADDWLPASFNPTGQQVNPFGYGQVIQRLTSTKNFSAQSVCQSVSPVLQCLSVSGGSSCYSPSPIGTLVSCNLQNTPHIDEQRFDPVNCNGSASGDGGRSGLMGSLDWCLTANYMPNRIADTVYQYNDYVRLGVNLRFGGMVTELYGTDKLDRILQNAGGGVQLSLWAYSDQYASKSLIRANFAVSSTASDASWRGKFDPAPFTSQADCEAAHPGEHCTLGVMGPNYLTGAGAYPCADNNGEAAAPFNPIQGASTPCQWGLPQGKVDTITSNAQGQITVSKSSPAHFTRSDSMQGLSWQQTSQVFGPAAIITYHMTSTTSMPDVDFQETPAIFTHGDLGHRVIYYSGLKPYNDVSGPVSIVDITNLNVHALELSARVGPFGTGAAAKMTEDWVSACDGLNAHCLTIATFSSTAQDIITSFSSDTSYFGIHSFFSLTNQMNRTVTVFLFPYRFDDVVQGKSIRSWIYYFHSNPVYRR